MDELQQKVAEIKSRPGERIEPLPEIKPYEAFAYNAASLRSPFVPSAPARNDVANAVRPDVKRPREFLEQFPLDSMRMVGTLQLQGRNYGLVQGKDGLVHRVLPGNYHGSERRPHRRRRQHQDFDHRDRARRSRRIHRASSRAGADRMSLQGESQNVVVKLRQPRTTTRAGASRADVPALVQRLACAAGAGALGTQAALRRAPIAWKTSRRTSLPGNKVELTLRLSDTAPTPLTFTVDNPARIALDLPDTTVAMTSRRVDVKQGALDTVNVAEANGRTRVVLNVDSLVPYETRVQGNTIVVTLGGGGTRAAAVHAALDGGCRGASQTPRSAAPVSGTRSVNNIDFRRGSDGSGRVIVELTDAKVPADLRQEGGRIVVNFAKTTLPETLMQRLDVIDFATPVSSVDALRVGDGTRLVIAASGDYEQLAYQSDNIYTIEIKPVVKLPPELQDKKEYTGERLTLNFQDIETRAVLQLLADTSGQNMVISDTVGGNVTLRLQNVPWDQALDIVMRTKGLDMRREGNVMFIAPAAEIAAREKELLAARKEVQELAPLRTEYLQVNYAKAGDLAGADQVGPEQLAAVRARQRRHRRAHQHAAAAGHLRAPGRHPPAGVDARHPGAAGADRSAHRDRQRRLQPRARRALRRQRARSITAAATAAASSVASDFVTEDDGVVLVASRRHRRPRRRLRTAAIRSTATWSTCRSPIRPAALALTLLDSDYIVDLELSAAQAEGRGEIISSPRLITANQREATIEQGVEIPYQESSSSGATTTSVQEGGAEPQGHAADHAGQPRHPRPDGREGQRRSAGRERHRRLRAEHRHARDRHAGAGERRPDGRAGRHPRDRAPRRGDKGAVAGRHSGAGPPVQDDHRRPTTRTSC